MIRPAGSQDLPFLRDMLRHAYYARWGNEADVPLERYVAGWGRRGDRALVAIDEFQPVGAAWYRLFALFTFISSYLVTGTHSLRSENPPLAARAEQLADREGVGGIPIRVENVHGETSAANAFTTGFGPSRKVFLWDTLLDGRFSDGEVLFVLAHEFGHQVRAHLVRAIAWYALFAVPGAFLIALATRRRGGMRQPEAVPLALLVLVVLTTVATPLQAAVTRHLEQEADWMALETTRDPASGQTLYQDLAQTSLSDPDPPTWAYLWFDDHPTIMQRIGMVRAWAVREGVREPRRIQVRQPSG